MTKTTTPKRRAGLYLRISEDRTGREAGVSRQEKDCRELAVRLDWEIVDLYTDNDVSAYNGKKRPAYERLKADLKTGRIDAVVVWHPDRLYRRSRDLLDLIDLLGETKPEVATVQAGTVDLSTANGRLVAKIGADVAEHESEHKAERVKRWHQERAEAGKPNGGHRPFGFCDDRVTIDETEAALIRDAAERVLAGETKWSVVDDWNRRGIPSVTGRMWTTTVLLGVLRSPRVAGLRQHNGATYPACWKAILDRETWEGVKALSARRTPPGRRAEYVLSNIARCGLCGKGLTGNRTNRGVRIYRCATQQSHGHGCGKVARDAGRLEGHVVELVFAALDGPRLAEAVRTRAADSRTATEAVRVLEALEGRLERLKNEYAAEGLWEKADFLRLRGELEGRIAEVTTQLAWEADRRKLGRLPKGNLREWWERVRTAERRQLLGLVVDQVLVHPTVRGGNRFDPGRVEVIWRA